MDQKIKLLFAEDEVDTRKNIVSYIKNHFSFDIIEVDNGQEAWKAYLEHKPQILITDISMPEKDGLDLIENIRFIDDDINIIVISAHTEKEKLMKAITMNLIDYHVKPIKRKMLIDSINKIINSI